MKRRIFALLALFSVLFVASAPALAAAGVRQIGTYGAWSVYAYSDHGDKVCYMTAAPEKTEASKKNVQRGDVYFYITHWSGSDARNEISVALGYPLKKEKVVTVLVDKQDFGLFAKGEMAWAQNSKADDAITDAVEKGSTLVVKGTSTRGTDTTDTYSLKGSADAYKAVAKACDFKP